jgi:hypothetical protein
LTYRWRPSKDDVDGFLLGIGTDVKNMLALGSSQGFESASESGVLSLEDVVTIAI